MKVLRNILTRFVSTLHPGTMANSDSVHEMSFTDVSYKATSSTTHIPRLPYLPPPTLLGEIDLRPKVTRTFPPT
jgi:hypothetical protein